VNMNGRVYDPELGRFLSPDPNVQFVADLQSYNRYTYAANNPLRYTDPTGYFLGGGFDFFVSALATITAIAVCTGPQAALCAAGFALGMTIYTTASAINSGAGWDQACAMGFTGFALGTIGGGVMGDLGVQGGWQILGGAISGAASSAVMTEMSGGGSLGKNILEGAFSGAAGAAVGYALQEGMVSVASAELQQGGGSQGGGDEGPKAEVRYVPGRRIEGDFWDSIKALAELNARCSAGPCSDFEIGVAAMSQNMPSAGVQVESTVMTSAVAGSGGTAGLNLQLTSYNEGSGLFGYYPTPQVPSNGLMVGGDMGFNLAIGNGSWTGRFDNYNLSIGPLSVSYFITPGWTGIGPGYTGLSLGLGTWGPPIGYGRNSTYYVPLSGQK